MDGHSQAIATSDTPAPEHAQGRTIISDHAVAKVVGVAARAVAGVHALGNGASRSIGAIRDVVGATDLTQGIRVEVGDTQVAVDIIVMADYGVPLQELAMNIRIAVYQAVEELVGRSVIEVNIEITDVYVPTLHENEKTRSRLGDRLGAGHKTSALTSDQGDTH